MNAPSDARLLSADDDRRLVALPGLANFRDAGGYATGTGAIRLGKLYRSDGLGSLGEEGREELRRRGVRVVVDLRDPAERDFSPSRLDGVPVTVYEVPLLARPTVDFIAADASLADVYDHIIDDRGAQLVAALRVLAASGDAPVIVHCTAGKDRTGIVIAFALLLAGVGRSDVVDDYARSADNLPVALMDEILTRLRAEHAHDGVHLDELVRQSPAAALERVLDRVERRHGSVEAYLRDHGLTDTEATHLRLALLARE